MPLLSWYVNLVPGFSVKYLLLMSGTKSAGLIRGSYAAMAAVLVRYAHIRYPPTQATNTAPIATYRERLLSIVVFL
jgi:hypothetical protein